MDILNSVSVPLCVASIAATIAAVTDVRRFRISNTLTIPLLLAGPIYHFAFLGTQSLVLSEMGILIGFLLLLPLYLVGGMGAGDIKLMAGLGAWLGPALILKTLLASSLLTGIFSAVVWAKRRSDPSFQPSSGRVEEAVASDSRRLRVVPFGVAVAIALPITWAAMFIQAY